MMFVASKQKESTTSFDDNIVPLFKVESISILSCAISAYLQPVPLVYKKTPELFLWKQNKLKGVSYYFLRCIRTLYSLRFFNASNIHHSNYFHLFYI